MDYIEYDGRKMVAVRCMNCKAAVQVLATGTLYTRDGEAIEVSQMFALKNMAKGEKIGIVNVHSGMKSYIEPILCSSCIMEELNKDEIIEQVKLGYRLGLKAQDKSEQEVEDYMKTHGNIRAEEINGC